jgi:hypothetical protein
MHRRPPAAGKFGWVLVHSGPYLAVLERTEVERIDAYIHLRYLPVDGARKPRYTFGSWKWLACLFATGYG